MIARACTSFSLDRQRWSCCESHRSPPFFLLRAHSTSQLTRLLLKADEGQGNGQILRCRFCFRSGIRVQCLQGTDGASMDEGHYEAAESDRNHSEGQPSCVLDKLHEAHDVIGLLFVEIGLSQDDAFKLSARAPLFAQKLVDSAIELKDFDKLRSFELSSHKSRGLNAADDERTTFRNYLVESAKNMGDRCLAPFLESLGVHHLDIPRISRLLPSDQIPEYMKKVHYLEAIIAMQNSCTSQKVDVLIRRMMKRLSIVVDEDFQQTLSLFEKVDAQRGGLGILNDKKHAVGFLVGGFPQILLRSLDLELRVAVDFLVALGVPSECIGLVIHCFPPILLYNVEQDLKPRLRTYKKVGVRARDLGKMIVKYPWLLSQSVEHNCEEIVAFLTNIKVPKGQVDKAVTSYPLILGSSSEILLRMVRRLNDLGVKSKRLGRVVAFSPQLLVKSPQEFDEVIVFLEKLGIFVTEMGRLIKKSPEVFASNIEKTLQVKTSFLQDLGLSDGRVSHVLQSYPEVLSMSIAALKQRTDYLLSAGLSEKDVAFMVGGFPQMLGYNVKAVFEPKLDFLVKDMGRSVNEVVSYPRFFSYSLEKRIKPRARIFAKRKLNYDLKTMLALNDDQFACQFLGFARMLVPPIQEVNPD